MYELKRNMTNSAGDTKPAGALVDAAWLGNSAEALVAKGWVVPVKRKPIKPVTIETNEELSNG